jgi:hypothetical protein
MTSRSVPGMRRQSRELTAAAPNNARFQSDTATVGSGRGLPNETYFLDRQRPNEDKMELDEIVPILKPCPFFGDRPPQIVRTGTFSVQCADCCATGPPE